MRLSIPSYNRSQIIIKKTIPTLLNLGFNLSDIDLFLFDEQSKKEYETQIINEFKSEVNIIVTNVLDLGERLNYILNEYYPEGTEVVLIEDDIRGIRQGKESVANDFFEKAFEICKKENRSIWGISPTNSTMFQSEGYSTNFKFIIGTLYGIIVRHQEDLNVSITYKQDFERTILYYKKDGGLIRFNDVYCRTTYRVKGGLGSDKDERLPKELAACQEMIAKYPYFCYQNKKKEREIKLFQNSKIVNDARKRKLEEECLILD
tara:strand:+ start:650 stop:1435 length:786 start_codon:yes stop_codon:yes gene_type:complete